MTRHARVIPSWRSGPCPRQQEPSRRGQPQPARRLSTSWYSLLLLSLLLTTPNLWAATTHCTTQERIIFACRTGKKLVSVCASPTVTPSSGTVQYRFGPAGAPELTLPGAPAVPRSVAQAGTLMFSGGGGAYLRFTQGAFGYVVYTAIGKSWGQKAGVAVEKDGKRTANLKCTGAVTSELGPDWYGQAGFPDDTQGFELP